MKAPSIFCLILAVVLSGCLPQDIGQTEVPTSPTVSITPIPPLPTSTLSPSPYLPTPLPSNTPTATTLPCDPVDELFCISDGLFLFQAPFQPPGMDSIERIYPYGSTLDGTRDPHHGVEFPNATGTTILSAANGTVVYAGNDSTQLFSQWTNYYGNLVIIDHETLLPAQKLFTLYAHLSRINVAAGQSVAMGQKIGEVGMSGSAFGSHLHFEIRTSAEDYRSTLNPELWIKPHEGNGSLALRIVNTGGEWLAADINLQYFGTEAIDTLQRAYPMVTYVVEALNPLSPWMENAGIGDLPAGNYRITFLLKGKLHERWIQIVPGQLTVATFIIE